METKQNEMYFLNSPSSDEKVGYVFVPQSEKRVTVGKLDGRGGNVSWEKLTRWDARNLYRRLRKEGYVKMSTDEVMLFRFRSSYSYCGTGFGTLEKANEWRENYLRSFHPAGYGTQVTVKPMDNGLARVSFTRSKSCD